MRQEEVIATEECGPIRKVWQVQADREEARQEAKLRERIEAERAAEAGETDASGEEPPNDDNAD